MSVRFRIVLNITIFKSVNDEFYILMIDIFRIGIKGLLQVQCTVIHFPFTCDKALATNLFSNTDNRFLLYVSNYDSIRRFVISILRLVLFHFLFAIILLIIDFHIISLLLKVINGELRRMCISHLLDTYRHCRFCDVHRAVVRAYETIINYVTWHVTTTIYIHTLTCIHAQS
jgi:hypothetical protein